MMPAGNLARMVAKNTVRSPRHFALSAFGIVIGIGAFVFFLALSLGVREVIFKVFPLDVVEVTRPRTTLGGKDVALPITDETVATVKQSPDVRDAIPRMKVQFPATGNGAFANTPIEFEVGGNTDGIDPSYVADDPNLKDVFKDWDAAEPNRRACMPPEIDFMGFGVPCPDSYYCDSKDRTCHHNVPAIVSPATLEMYNTQIAASHDLPMIPDFAQFMLDRANSDRLTFDIRFGESMIALTDMPKGSMPRTARAQLIGISQKAIPLGMTVPLEYVRRWNREFKGKQASESYSSIIVTLRDKDRLAPFTGWLEDDNGPDGKLGTADDGPILRVQDPIGVKFATAIFIVTTLFILISFTIVTISSVNIAHNFFMQVSERRREIGLLRAVGATRADVRFIILGEAALIGLIAGVIGILLSVIGGAVVDWAFATYLPRFPFKPPTYFSFQPWMFALGLVFSTLFCVLGGFLPARKAARLQPAQALAQN